jgi:hypothetical protein
LCVSKQCRLISSSRLTLRSASACDSASSCRLLPLERRASISCKSTGQLASLSTALTFEIADTSLCSCCFNLFARKIQMRVEFISVSVKDEL